MKNLILDTIYEYCNENVNWDDRFIRQEEFEVYENKVLKAVINFEVEVLVNCYPVSGDYFNPPEYGDCDFELSEIEVLEAKNKDKLQIELDNLKGKML